jgi:hypothetical protein
MLEWSGEAIDLPGDKLGIPTVIVFVIPFLKVEN